MCKDKKYVVVGGNGDAVYRRLMTAIGREDLLTDDLAHNPGRVEKQTDIDEAISAWTKNKTLEQVLAILENANVPCGSIYDAKDIFQDPHYQAREMLEKIAVGQAETKHTLVIAAMSPKLSKTPGCTRWAGPDLGYDTRHVLKEWAAMDDVAVDALHLQKIVYCADLHKK